MFTAYMLMWTLILLASIIVLGSAAYAGISAAPWLPTLPSQRRHLIENLKLEPGQTVVDLGCGDGSVLFAVGKKHPQVTCIGYDISFIPLALAWIRKVLYSKHTRNVSIRFGNLFTKDISHADIVFVFLLDRSYPRLIQSFATRLKPEAKVVVEAWPFPGFEPIETITGPQLLPVYIYSASSFRK